MRQCIVLCLLMVMCIGAYSQKTISGKVTTTNGDPVPFASVSFNNRTGGTTTTAGTYSISVNDKPGKYNLVISAIGFKTYSHTITITGDANYTADAVLGQDALNLDEVVVTGTSAGTTRRQLGSYISTVKADELNRAGAGNVLQALQGKTAGAQIIQNNGDPGGGLSVRLRGVSSVNSSSDPLYIVDGVL
jgi:hypothetical protein